MPLCNVPHSCTQNMSLRPVTRICVACRQDVAIADQYCPACGVDTQSAIIPDETHSLRTKAVKALPTVLTLGLVALRVGFKLGRAPWLRQALSLWTGRSAAPTSMARQPPGAKPRRIHICSRWVVRDSQGRTRQGTEEHLIDIS